MSNYSNFVFYGSWRDMLDGFEKRLGKEFAAEALYNLMLMATSGEIRTDDPLILGFITGCCMPNIEAAQDRYNQAKNGGTKGGRPKTLSKEDNELIAIMRKEGRKQIDIANAFNVSADTIRRSDGWRNYLDYVSIPAKVLPDNFAAQPAKLAKPSSITQKPEIEIDIYNEKEIDKEIEALNSMDKETFDFEYECFIQGGLSELEAKKRALEAIDMTEE